MKKIGFVFALMASVSIMSYSHDAYARSTSFSRSSSTPSRLFGTQTRSSKLSFSSSSSSSNKSNSVLGRISNQNQNTGSMNNFWNKKTVAVGVGAGAGATIASGSNSNTSDTSNSSVNRTNNTSYNPPSYGYGHYSQPVQATPSVASVHTQPQTPPVIVHEHYHDDSGSYLSGVVAGSILSHHSEPPVIINTAPVPVQQSPAYNNPMAYTPSNNANIPPAMNNSNGNQEHHSHWLLFSLLGLGFVIGGGVLIYRMRKNNSHRTLVENVIDGGIRKVEHRNDPVQQDMEYYDNPLGIQIALDGRKGKTSVIGIDLDVRVQSMSATGFFPEISGKTFVVSGYSRIEMSGPLQGVIAERVYLEDDSMFIQMILSATGEIQEMVLYTNINKGDLSEDDIRKIGSNISTYNKQTLLVNDNNGDKVVYSRIIHPEEYEVPMIDAEEKIMSSRSADINNHKLMIFERSHGDMSEFLMPDVRYVTDDNGDITDYAFMMAIGIPVNQTSIHSY